MKGSVLDFSIQSNAGVISADDGNRYSFSGSDWQIPGPPRRGIRVDFDANGSTATGIYADVAATAASGAAPIPTPAGNVPSTAVPTLAPRYSTLGIIGTYAGLLSIFFLDNALLSFPLMLVGLGISIIGWIIGTRRGERVGFARVGVALNITPFFLKVVSTATSSLIVGGSLDGSLPSLMSAVLPFI